MDISLLQTELQQVFGFLQLQEDREAMKKYVETNKKVFSHLSADAALFLAAAAKGTQLLKKLNTKEETVDMCKALDDLYNDGIIQGEIKGEIKGFKQGEELFAALSGKLLGDLRIEDLKKAAASKEYRNTLYQEYGIGNFV